LEKGIEMIRFDEVPIKRDFKASDGDTYTRLINFKRWEHGEEEEYNSIGDTGILELFSGNEMVELVDKCANCRHYKSNSRQSSEHPRPYCHMNEILNQDPETFWCSEGELK